MTRCSCCAQPAEGTAAQVDNLPGQSQLAYRVGTHASFLTTMKERLAATSARLEGTPQQRESCLDEPLRGPLAGGADDAATALLDCWACVADVLTFYQERIANEAYLRTATEERSVSELGRLTGYAPRPGVAATAHVAFTVQPGFDGEIPERTKLQSQPRPGKDAQTFETSAPLTARAEWNSMRPLLRSTTSFYRREMTPGAEQSLTPTGRLEIYLRGSEQNVRVGDLILLERPSAQGDLGWVPCADELFRVELTRPEPQRGQTTVRLVPFLGEYSMGFFSDRPTCSGFRQLGRTETASAPRPPLRKSVIGTRLIAQRALSMLRSPLAPQKADGASQPAALRLRKLEPGAVRLALAQPGGVAMVSRSLPGSLRVNALQVLQQITAPVMPRAYVFRATAQPFGHNAPEDATVVQTTLAADERVPGGAKLESRTEFREKVLAQDELQSTVFLDGTYPKLQAHQHVVITRPKTGGKEGEAPSLDVIVTSIREVSLVARDAYGMKGKASRLVLAHDWRRAGWEASELTIRSQSAGASLLAAYQPPRPQIGDLRENLFYVDAEELTLLPAPGPETLTGAQLLLDGAVGELPVGRLLIVEGEVAEFADVVGQRTAQLVRVTESATSVDPPDAGEVNEGSGEITEAGSPHTSVSFTPALLHPYKRDSLRIYGNVAPATHGETREQVLGSGDAAQSKQSFALRQGPRTWIFDPGSPSGVKSTLEVRVDGVRWSEVASFLDAGPRDQVVRTLRGADGLERVVGGDGRRGARFRTGIENITARYRVGIGPAGNVDALAIKSLSTKPIGVQDVINPLRASGGAAPDDVAAMRARIPIAARGEDRLVSLQDYVSFALEFAGIEKARASVLPSESGLLEVRVIVAGAEDTPLDATLVALRGALARFGDQDVRLVLQAARADTVQLEARVRIDARYEWPGVEQALRGALTQTLGWAKRQIGDAMALSQLLAVMQAVPGVLAVDVEGFGKLGTSVRSAPMTASMRADGLAAVLAEAGTTQLGRPWTVSVEDDVLLYFAVASPESISLTEIKS